jgi:predicted dehydrogenase
MRDGLRINGEEFSKLYTRNVALGGSGVAFFNGKTESDADMEARLWIEAIINDTEPLVKPEQAFVVTQILEAIYESAKTGKAIYF